MVMSLVLLVLHYIRFPLSMVELFLADAMTLVAKNKNRNPLSLCRQLMHVKLAEYFYTISVEYCWHRKVVLPMHQL